MPSPHGILGPRQDTVWRRFADEVRGNVLEGTMFTPERVLIARGAWTIVLDTLFSAASKSTDTRLRAPFVNPGRFRLAIYRRGLLSDLAVKLGMQDVEVGHHDFDREFVIKGNSDSSLRALLDDPRLRQLLAAQRSGRLEVQDVDKSFQPLERHPAVVVDELCFTIPGVVKDLARLRDALELVGQALDRLRWLGAAAPEAPSATRCLSCGHQLLRQSICPECGKPVTGQRGVGAV